MGRGRGGERVGLGIIWELKGIETVKEAEEEKIH